MPGMIFHLRTRGIEGLIGDPRDLVSSRGRLLLRGQPVDVLYRNIELGDFVDIEEEEGHLHCEVCARHSAAIEW